PLGPRSLAIPDLPEELRGSPGIPIDRAAVEESYHKDGPLPHFLALFREARIFNRRQMWRMNLIMDRRLERTGAAIQDAPIWKAGVTPQKLEPVELTRLIKTKAAELGISAVGVTKPDPLMMFAGDKVEDYEQSVVVCILEQNWEATQSIPSMLGERGHNEATARLRELSADLASYMRDLG